MTLKLFNYLLRLRSAQRAELIAAYLLRCQPTAQQLWPILVVVIIVERVVITGGLLLERLLHDIRHTGQLILERVETVVELEPGHGSVFDKGNLMRNWGFRVTTTTQFAIVTSMRDDTHTNTHGKHESLHFPHCFYDCVNSVRIMFSGGGNL